MALTVILLSAGYATRLYPLTAHSPKALLPLGDGVILDEVLRSLPRVTDVRQKILVTNHLFAEPFQQWQKARKADIRILDDQTTHADNRLGAIRDLQLACRLANPEDDLLVIGTDNVFTWSLADFVEKARTYHPHASVGLWQVSSKSAATQFGVVTRDPSGQITSFVEKSPQPPSTEVALCIYYLPTEVCNRIELFLEQGGNPDAPGFFFAWLAEREPVYGILMEGAWYDIGTLEAYQAAMQTWPMGQSGRSFSRE